MGGWKVAEIEKTARALDWGFKIRCIGGPQELPDILLDTIAKYTTQEELTKAPGPIAEFLNTVKQGQFSAADAEPFIEEFFAPISKAGKLHETLSERLEQFKQEPEVVTRTLGRRGHGLRRDVNLRRLLKAASTVLDELVESGEEVTYIDEFFRLLNGLEGKLHRVAKRHRQPAKAAVPSDMWSNR